ncbi:DUF1028 domain-containing protein [Qingshengfaniella alkalisoli]|uniref:DUF1028 domain-containing protein n=1 Tax=Qingshengfaniella alkalisoli TaxID=2599296 RepID=A0A5B8I9L1_9RHOB|nr:DUF1028 domain-containing protein [Qingshengfaniella alkalisoli]QDY70985.1 DUF1028 domain-containing protein [Qingshengfaniella alkalisoli]
MTYSIIAKDADTGEIGLAVASRFFAAGAAVGYLGRNCAVATQAFVNPMWGVEGRVRLSVGEAADRVFQDLRARDDGEAIRQCHMLDNHGNFAAHTGADCVDWAGHRCGRLHSVAGNMLTGPEVVDATFDAFAEAKGALADRLLAAMDAGLAAGGDKRGQQSAALTIHRGQPYPFLSLRVDDDAAPLDELRRLLDVSSERYIHVAEAMPTEQNFSGTPTRDHIDQKIKQADADRIARGRPSLSRATTQGKA